MAGVLLHFGSVLRSKKLRKPDNMNKEAVANKEGESKSAALVCTEDTGTNK